MKRILEVKKQIGKLSKTETNPFFKSSYLDLNGLLEAIEPLLWEYNLMLLQPIENGYVKSCIIDIETNLPIIESSIQLPNITDPQKLGSAITYFRRYTLKSLLAISEEDDDGNKASKPEVKKKPELTDEGFNTLMNGTNIEFIVKALNTRTIDEARTVALKVYLKELQDGND